MCHRNCGHCTTKKCDISIAPSPSSLTWQWLASACLPPLTSTSSSKMVEMRRALFANDTSGSLLHNWNWIIEKPVFQRKKALKMVTHAIDIFQSTTKIKLVRQSNETTSHLEHQIRIWKKIFQRCLVNLDPHDLSLVVTLLLR